MPATTRRPVPEVHRLWTLPADSASIRRARHSMRGLLRRIGCEGEVVEVAELLTSELVTNALMHSDSRRVVLCLQRRRRCVHIEVRDEDPEGRLESHVPPAASVGGRGLVLVDRLSDEWGVERTPAAKAVWFNLACA